MTKLQGPGLSLTARQRLGPLYMTAHPGNIHAARKLTPPAQPNTWPQRYHRWLYSDYVFQWQNYTQAQRDAWRTTANLLGITPYNAFIRDRLSTLPDIAAAWHLDEDHGVIAQDFSKNARHLTLYGPRHVPGPINLALDFDGVDDYGALTLAKTPTIRTAITIEAYANLRANQEAGIVESYNAYGLECATHTAYQANMRVHIDGTNYPEVAGTKQLGAWKHYAGTYDSATRTINLYIDGILVGTRTLTGLSNYLIDPPNTALVIGASNAGYERLNGQIDEPRIYTRALSQPEIWRHAHRR